MSQAIPGLNTRAELELFLVLKHAKPAAHITLDAFVEWIDEDRTARGHTGFSSLTKSLPLSEANLRTLELYFSYFSLHYHVHERRDYSVSGAGNKEYTIDAVDYYIGQDVKSLTNIISVFAHEDDYLVGQALGFPEESCRAFGKIIDGVKRNYSYTQVQLARARNAHIAVPSWMAYVTWVPDQIDFISGRISTSTQELAKLYQLVIREFNPELARRVEANFRNDPLPIHWQLKHDGEYEIQYPVF